MLTLGSETPWRVEVAFFGGQLAGKTAWVPPNRLKVLWADSAQFIKDAEAWLAITSEPDDVEWWAVASILEVLLLGAAETGYNNSARGTVAISDRARVDAAIGGDLEDLLAGRVTVSDEEGAHYEWAVAVAIARRAYERSPQRVMSFVAAEDAKPLTDSYDEFVRRPSLDLLREWGKREQFDAHDELYVLRRELTRQAKRMDLAIALLADTGQEQMAWRLYLGAHPGAKKTEWRELLAETSETRNRWRFSAGLS